MCIGGDGFIRMHKEGKTEETSKEESVHVDDVKYTTDTTEETNKEDIFSSH